MATEKDLRDAKAFAAAYEPSEDDHPDLHSRVVMFRRALDEKTGSKRAAAIHARTLMRFVGHLGLETPAASKSSDSDGPTKAELQERARELGLPTSGSKAALASRITEAEQADGDPDGDPDADGDES